MKFNLPPVPLTPIDGFEALVPGQQFRLGSVILSRDEIVAFASDFDPQPFHLDEAAAAGSIFGTLIASGLHTISALFGLSVRTGLLARCNLGGSGMESVRWHRPVLPLDELHLAWTVLAIIPTARHPDRARVDIRSDVTNQHDQLVLSFVLHHLVAGRPA